MLVRVSASQETFSGWLYLPSKPKKKAGSAFLKGEPSPACVGPGHPAVPRGQLCATGLCWGGTNCNDTRQGALGPVKLYLGPAVHSPDTTPPADSWAWDVFKVHRICQTDPFTSPFPPLHCGGLSPLSLGSLG